MRSRSSSFRASCARARLRALFLGERRLRALCLGGPFRLRALSSGERLALFVFFSRSFLWPRGARALVFFLALFGLLLGGLASFSRRSPPWLWRRLRSASLAFWSGPSRPLGAFELGLSTGLALSPCLGRSLPFALAGPWPGRARTRLLGLTFDLCGWLAPFAWQVGLLSSFCPCSSGAIWIEATFPAKISDGPARPSCASGTTSTHPGAPATRRVVGGGTGVPGP